MLGYSANIVRFGNVLAMQVDARSSRCNVRYWPKADILIAWANVRFRG
jgi:hypothetical protein